MKPSIAFIEPISPFGMFPNFKLPMIGPIYLATILKKAGYNVTIYSEHFKKVYSQKKNQIKRELLNYGVVCISIMTAAAKRGYEIAKLIKQAVPQIKIIIGGIHASFMPEEALEYADQVVVGEGEEVILDMVEGKITDKIVRGKPVENLDGLPAPDFSLVKYMKLPRIGYAYPISTSRGCPYDCEFCSVSKMFGTRFRFRSVESVVEEMKQRAKEGNRNFFFYDDNFMANLPRVKKILRRLLEEKVNFYWGAQGRVSIAKDEELMDLMRKTRCHFVLLGLESLDDEVLMAMNKKQNTKDVENAIEKFNKYGIGIYAAFVFGTDIDKANCFGKTLAFCHKHDFLATQFTINTPLPGSNLYHRLSKEGRLLTKDWNLFDTGHTVFKSIPFTPYELQQKTMWMWKQFYSLPKVLQKLWQGEKDKALLRLVMWFKVNQFIARNKQFFKRLRTEPAYIG